MMHSTHFIYGYMVTGIWYRTIQIVGEETHCCHYMGFFYMHYPTDRITHTTAFVIPVVEHWLEWEIAQWAHQEWILYHTATSHSFNESGSPLLALPIHELLGIGKHINMSIYFQDVDVSRPWPVTVSKSDGAYFEFSQMGVRKFKLNFDMSAKIINLCYCTLSFEIFVSEWRKCFI